MITVHTGLPGNGKTLFTISHVLKTYKDRPIYYHGITDLVCPWIEMDDPDTWYELEEGAVIVIDEAQKIFPTVSPSAPKPPKISEFETHRHKGFDIILITQDAMLLDSRVRRLAGCHRHLMRPLGMERANVYEWQKVSKPNDYHDKQEAVRTTFKFDKSVYDLYKSSEIHTHNRQIPTKPILMGLGCFGLVALCAYFGYGLLSKNTQENQQAQSTEPTESNYYQAQPSQEQSRALSQEQHQLFEAHRIQDQFSPVVSGHPYTAAFYRELMVAAVLPKISGCGEVVRTRNGKTTTTCKCNTQQGTTFPIELEVCQYYVENGWFDFTGTQEQSAPSNRDVGSFANAANPFATTNTTAPTNQIR